MIARGGVRIDRARLHGGVSADRERLASALDRISPAAIGLSPQAILIVRRLAPRARLTRSGGAEPFVAGVQEDLRRRVATARRGRIGRDDEDLLFEDEADLEAAIVLDWLAGGGTGARRWWREVISESTPVQHWRQAILNEPPLLPRIVVRLAEHGDAVRWLEQFQAGEVLAAVVRLLRAHGVAHTTVADLQSGTAEAHRRDQREALHDLVAISPEAAGVARRDVAALIAVSAVIVRRPAWVGARRFSQAIAALAAARLESPRAEPARPYVGRTDRSHDVEAPRLRTQLRAGETRRSAQSRRNRRPASGSDEGPEQHSDPLALPTAAALPIERRPSDLPDVLEAIAPSPDPRAVATGFGGLFFLLNVFLVLGVYGDFTRPSDGLKGLSPFELLLLLGRRWFGKAFVADPLAELLAELAGLQPGERPGRLFEAPTWSIPDAWLSPWIAAGLTRPDAVFAFADDASVPRAAAWRRRRWLTRLSGFLQARLTLALGERDGRSALVTTCRQPGRITRDRDRLEIHFPLADHPIALRLAGLDRDPGWIPAAARYVEFRFT